MYTCKNYKTKKELVTDFKAGVQIETFQPGGIFEAKKEGRVSLEGPHYPEAHKWYASAELKNGLVVKLK